MTSTAAEIGTAYFNAWANKDVETAVSFLTEDVEIVAPNGHFTGHPGFREFMEGFVTMLTGVDDFLIHGDEHTALSWYDTHLQAVPSLPAGERITIRDGKISHIQIAFDQMPLAQAFGGQAPSH